MEYIKLTHHAQIDRAERLSYLVTEIGIGSCIFENRQEDGRIMRITSTGLYLVFTREKTETLLTGFPLTVSRAIAIYRKSGYSGIPHNLYKAILQNEKKYKNTNWYWK